MRLAISILYYLIAAISLANTEPSAQFNTRLGAQVLTLAIVAGNEIVQAVARLISTQAKFASLKIVAAQHIDSWDRKTTERIPKDDLLELSTELSEQKAFLTKNQSFQLRRWSRHCAELPFDEQYRDLVDTVPDQLRHLF